MQIKLVSNNIDLNFYFKLQQIHDSILEQNLCCKLLLYD